MTTTVRHHSIHCSAAEVEYFKRAQRDGQTGYISVHVYGKALLLFDGDVLIYTEIISIGLPSVGGEHQLKKDVALLHHHFEAFRNLLAATPLEFLPAAAK